MLLVPTTNRRKEESLMYVQGRGINILDFKHANFKILGRYFVAQTNRKGYKAVFEETWTIPIDVDINQMGGDTTDVKTMLML